MPIGPNDPLVLSPGLVAVDLGGFVFVQTEAATAIIPHLSPQALRAITAAVGPGCTAAQAYDRLSSQYDPRALEKTFEALLGTVLALDGLEEGSEPKPPADEIDPATGGLEPLTVDQPVALLSASSCLAEIRDALSRCCNFQRLTTVAADAFHSHTEDRFVELLRQCYVLEPPPVPSPAAGEEALDVAALARAVRGHSLVLCALGGHCLQALMDVEAACLEENVPCLFLAPRPPSFEVGPMLLDSTTAGPACVVLNDFLDLGNVPGDLEVLRVLPVPRLDVKGRHRQALSSVLKGLGREVRAVLSDRDDLSLKNACLRVSPQQGPSLSAVKRLVVPSRPTVRLTPAGETRNAILVAAGQRPVPPSQPTQYKRVGILGGGTAGYLTAIALRTLRPDIEVTLLESSKIPVIGVGEATTSDLPPFLHTVLGFPIVEFYEEVTPTWKLGIRFEWGEPGDYYFNYPFDKGKILEAKIYDDDIRNVSLLSLFMSHDKGMILAGDPDPVSLMGDFPFAYHLENRRFVKYLKKKATQTNTTVIDCTIKDVEKSPDGENVQCLIDDTGKRYEFDLYVDCSGFRSVLIGDALESPFINYDSLITDTAVVASVPHNGLVKPYTTAESMDAGWCWNIPVPEEDHRGYVFSSDFITVEEAAAEMRRKNPGMGDYSVVRFRSGRREHFFKGNVVAMGNAYGFVEPLESTALQLLVQSIMMLIRSFPNYKFDTIKKRSLNQMVANNWDYVRDFLAIHYKFNRRIQSPFWNECRENVELGGAQTALDFFQRRAPLSYSQGLFPEGQFGGYGFDVLLFGQRIPAELMEAQETPSQYRRRVAAYRHLASQSLAQRQCLKLIAEDPEILHRHASSDWMQYWWRDLGYPQSTADLVA